jgi:hypothetical protein
MKRLMHQLLRPRFWPVLLLLALLLAACSGRDRRIQPVIPTPDPQAGGDLVLGQPMLVSFTALNDDASANLTETQFRNQLIRVTGAYVPGEPLRCGGEPRNGPVTSWALVAENLRLEVSGLEEVVELVPEGTQMTVEGYWRVYEGPVGCGKEPPAGLRFYLDARQIIAPNPLPVVAGADAGAQQVPPDGEDDGRPDGPGRGGIGTPAPPQTPQPGNGGASATPGGQVTVFVTPTRIGTGTATVTAASTGTPTATGTPTLTGTPGATPTPSRTGTPTLTSTPGAGPTPSPTNTPLGQATPEPTATGGSYPGPDPTPSATPTPTPGY